MALSYWLNSYQTSNSEISINKIIPKKIPPPFQNLSKIIKQNNNIFYYFDSNHYISNVYHFALYLAE